MYACSASLPARASQDAGASRKRYPQVSWKGIAGMRDVLVHDYYDIDIHVIWKTVRQDIESLPHYRSTDFGESY
ncbi:MAG: DUF86 domain-containing protein [Fimbriimonadales bacterium]